MGRTFSEIVLSIVIVLYPRESKCIFSMRNVIFLCSDIKEGFLWIWKDLCGYERISHEYVWGYVVDIKEFLWIYLDNLTQDRWRRGQCPIPVRGPATVIAAALIWLSVRVGCTQAGSLGMWLSAPNVPVMSAHNACNRLNLCPAGPAMVISAASNMLQNTSCGESGVEFGVCAHSFLAVVEYIWI